MRAKFKVTNKTEFEQNSFSIKLIPVVNGSIENEQFYKWTPAGEINLSTVNRIAADGLEVGSEYYIDFTKAN